MQSTATKCRAKSPSSCPHHGSGGGNLISRIKSALKLGDYAAYEEARNQMETSKRAPRSLKKASKRNLSCDGCSEYGKNIVANVSNPRMMSRREASPFACPSCGTSATKSQDRRLVGGDDLITCQICSKKYHVETAEMRVLAKSHPFMSAEIVRNATWYHATVIPNWHEAVSEASVYVHAGSREAALERATHEFFPLGKKVTDRTIYLWELSINSDAVITDDVLNDDNKWPSKVSDCSREHLGGDVQRYLNRWESPGSISLLANPKAFNPVSVKKVSSTDCAPYIQK